MRATVNDLVSWVQVITEPVPCLIRRTPDGFYAIHSPYFDEDGYGDMPESALHDFLTSLMDRYHSLRRHVARISPDEAIILGRLTEWVECGKWLTLAGKRG